MTETIKIQHNPAQAWKPDNRDFVSIENAVNEVLKEKQEENHNE